MKKLLVLAAVFCLCFQTIAVSAATPDYSGEWLLNAGKSKLPETAKIETMSLKVSQTDKELKVESIVKRSADAKPGGVGGGMRRGGNGGGTQTVIYSLDEKETVSEIGSGIMAGSESRQAKAMADGKLSLTAKRVFKTEMGDAATKTNETWELLDSGKTLKIIRYVETPRGGINWEMYFTKKVSENQAAASGETPDDKVYQGAATGGANQMPKMILGGVVNGKAVSLPKPNYPSEARGSGAVGAVNVKITIDELGDVISAEAVSGDALLRDASVEAVKKAKFAPTVLSGNPVKVTGIIVYNFVP